MILPEDYCELSREFAHLGKDKSDHSIDSYESDLAFRYWRSKSWDELHEESETIIILGEPGSGRSYEFKAQCDHLNATGGEAFYIELHRLISLSVSDIFNSTAEQPRYDSWLKSGKRACFFLDAVDEAKLDKALDFNAALHNFRQSMGARISNTKIYISSRISSWMPVADHRTVKEALDFTPKRTKDTPDSEQHESAPSIQVYIIKPLDRENVLAFSKSNIGLEADEFIKALDRSHSWEFARRPLDVSFLLRYWKAHGRIGSLSDLLEETTLELLKERPDKPDHSKVYPLSEHDAREGAEAMAATSVFCRTLDFSISEAPSLQTNRALLPLDCLPATWDVKMCSALIDRPIFDSAIYGTIRFHHRRIAEYLAACWLKRRMDQQCPFPVLKDFLFDESDTRIILRPSVASVATWLACIGDGAWAMDLRGLLLKASPKSFLCYGDPARLPTNFKSEILEAFIARYRGCGYLRIETDRIALSRIAEEELGLLLAAHIRDHSNGNGVRIELLKIAVEGRCAACLEAAFDILVNRSDSLTLETQAIELVKEAGDLTSRLRLKEIALGCNEFSTKHLGQLFRVLYPDALTVGEFRGLLLQTPYLGKLTTQRYYINKVLEDPSASWDPIEMLRILCDINAPAADIRYPHRGEQYSGSWTREFITPVLRHVLQNEEIALEDSHLVGTACFIIAKHPTDRISHNSEENEFNLDQSTSKHPEVRREAFWIALQHEVAESTCSKVQNEGYWAFHHKLNFTPNENDINWLIVDIQTKENTFDRQVAAWFAVECWKSDNRSYRSAMRILNVVRSCNVDHKDILKEVIRAKLHWPPQWYWKLKRKGIFNEWFWSQRWHSIKSRSDHVRSLWNLHSQIAKLRSGKRCGWLVSLSQECDSSSKWAVQDWAGLKNKYGERITRATQEGCVNIWKQYTPVKTEGDGIPNGLIAGLSGLQFLYQTNPLVFKSMSTEDALRAAKYSVIELNGHADWMGELAQQHPNEVRDTLIDCIQFEWSAPKNPGFWCRHLDTLASADCAYAHLVCDEVLNLFQDQIPLNSKVISCAFKLLVIHGKCTHITFSERSAQRLNSIESEDEQYLPWLAMCLQTNATTALTHIENRSNTEFREVKPAPTSNFMLSLCVLLSGRHESFPLIVDPEFLRLEYFERFYRLVYKFVNPSEDTSRSSGESFTPEPRDDAQSYRGSLLSQLMERDDPQAEEILMRFRDSPEFADVKDWLEHLLDQRADRLADGPPLTPSDVRNFEAQNEVPPKTDQDLFNLVLRRLSAIKHDIEDADHSIRNNIREGDKEVDFRRFVGRELNRRKNGHYNCPEETVIRDEERLDIRIENPTFKGHVVIETKVADLGRSVNSLICDLENQLAERYLRDASARFGIYLIGHIKTKTWEDPNGGSNLNFEQVIEILSARAKEIEISRQNAIGLRVVGMDFRPPTAK